MLVRAYNPETDYDLVASWWGDSAIHPSCLSFNGVFGLENGKEVCCAWLYLDNCSSVAKIANAVFHPEFPDSPAFAHVIGCLKMQADNAGKLLDIERPFDGSALLAAIPKDEHFMDRCHDALSALPQGDYETRHIFTPGLYCRQIFIPAGTLCMSKIHKTEHPFIISKGDISVYSPKDGIARLKAPHTGITRPGTQRVLFAHQDTIWTTMHAGPEKTVEEFEARIIEPRKELEAK